MIYRTWVMIPSLGIALLSLLLAWIQHARGRLPRQWFAAVAAMVSCLFVVGVGVLARGTGLGEFLKGITMLTPIMGPLLVGHAIKNARDTSE